MLHKDYSKQDMKPAFGFTTSTRQSRSYSFRDIADIGWRYRVFLAAVIGLGTVLAMLVALLITPIYTATSAIVFDRNDSRPYEAVIEAQKQERDKSAMDTELDMARSRVFAGLVVDKLKLVDDPHYNTYLPEIDKTGGIVGWLENRINRLVTGKEEDRTKAARKGLIAEGVQRDRAITTLLATYTVDRKGDSLALTIKVDHEDPARAAEIANAIAQEYVSWASGMKRAATIDTVNYLRKQAEELGLSIADRERQIATFTAQSDLTFDPKDDLLRARMEQLNEQYTTAKVDEASAWAKVDETRRRLTDADPNGVGKVVSSDLLTSLRTEESRLVRLRAQLTAKFGNNHPQVLDVDAELASNHKLIADEAQRILQEFENDAKIASIRAKKFEEEVRALQEQTKSRNLAEIRRRELERDLLSEQKRYDAVVLRLGTLDPEREVIKATATVASFAEIPSTPSFPQPMFLIGAGFVGSVLIAFLIVAILDSLDDRIRRREDFEQVAGAPTIQSIPDFRSFGFGPGHLYQSMIRNPSSRFGRAMGRLSLAWRTVNHSPGGKVVMFVSPERHAGSTTISLGMSTVAKYNGLKTLLIDLDPGESGAAAQAGITAPTSDLVHLLSADGLRDRVKFNTQTGNTPNIVKLNLTFGDYEPLFARLREHFDLVVVDAPPISEGDDALWIANHMDQVYVVVAMNHTRFTSLADLASRMESIRGHISGLIINHADTGTAFKIDFDAIWESMRERIKLLRQRWSR